MSDMIERVATALKEAIEHSGVVRLRADGPNGELALKQFFEVLAMDAIESMREPTDEMITCSDKIHWGYGCNTCGGLTEGWYKMMDAALGKVDA